MLAGVEQTVWGHSGVTLAALVGEFAAIEILDGADIAILHPYRPHRFRAV